MFNWFYRWFYNRNRAIFRFWDGRRWRCVDPQAVWLSLNTNPEFDIENDPTFHDNGHRDSTEKCLAATRTAFGVESFDGSNMSGLTEDETLGLYCQFGQWIQAVKKNISRPQTSSESMDRSPESSTVPTSNFVESPSTCAESNSVEPDRLPTESKERSTPTPESSAL